MQKVETWYKAQGRCKSEEYELASYLLFEAGVETLEELESENPEWTSFRFFTGEKNDRDKIVAQFPEYEFEISEEPAKDWDKWWRDRAEPVAVSPHLWVRPPWVQFSPEDKDSIVLELEAKTAFGTGEHETTSSTAALMEAIDFNGKSVLDIGTGTGILAMFARRRGAKLAVGTEIDPQALPCIAENFERNHFQDSCAVLGFLDAFADDAKFDVIVCNMIRSELWPLRDDIENLLADNGYFVVSGQLEEEKQYVLDWFNECGFTLDAELIRGEWWSARARRS
ncbi:MAG: 50S ribosomal protein L11 methyltransferase [Fibrobacteraceae bacterium]|jgi:ribosomal protein L11 methyltransferase|nr:50S ribosomal protein L11 methyltransferase [Fibrobacteraceae bacterium]